MSMEKILFADDEPDIVKILKRYLELDGYEVDISFNGRDALNKIAANKYDLLILDVMMPEVNGWEVCKKVKEDPQTKNIPVIILTAKAQNVDALMSYECGADEYAPKPFDYPKLSLQIKKLLAKKE